MGLIHSVNVCIYNFTIAPNDPKKFDITFTIVAFNDGFPPLSTSINKRVMFEYPSPSLDAFKGPPLEGYLMEVPVYYPYNFGISVIVWVKTATGTIDKAIDREYHFVLKSS